MWESPDGCMMLSSSMQLSMPGQRLPFLQYLVSLAVVEAVQREAARCLQVGHGWAPLWLGQDPCGMLACFFWIWARHGAGMR